MARSVNVPLNMMPTSAEELERCLADPEWRLFSGCLYKIMVKGDDKDGKEGDTFSLPFIPNRAQRRFIKRLWHRNIILSIARQYWRAWIETIWRCFDRFGRGRHRPPVLAGVD